MTYRLLEFSSTRIAECSFILLSFRLVFTNFLNEGQPMRNNVAQAKRLSSTIVQYERERNDGNIDFIVLTV